MSRPEGHSYSSAMTSHPSRPARDGSSVQSVDRAVSALEILARRGEAGVSEIAAEIGVHKSTAFRLLASLERRDIVEQNGDRGTYRLGIGLLRLAGAVPARTDLTVLARPVCERLAADLAETVNLAVARSGQAVNLDQVRGPATVTADSWVGRPTPLHATSSGKVLLAWRPADELRALAGPDPLPAYTPHTLTRVDDLVDDLATVRERGYAVTVEEYETGLNAVAAPVRDRAGSVVAAVSASGPAYRFAEEQLLQAGQLLAAAARELSHRMGHLG